MVHRILNIRENQAEIVLSVKLAMDSKTRTNEIARFSKCGMGYVALGAAGRAIVEGVGFVDEISFHGHADTYKMLVGLGVIIPMSAAA